MAYLAPSEFVTKMVDAGESKLLMSTRDTLIRSFMAGAMLALGAAFAVTVTVNTGNALQSIQFPPVNFDVVHDSHSLSASERSRPLERKR